MRKRPDCVKQRSRGFDMRQVRCRSGAETATRYGIGERTAVVRVGNPVAVTPNHERDPADLVRLI